MWIRRGRLLLFNPWLWEDMAEDGYNPMTFELYLKNGEVSVLRSAARWVPTSSLWEALRGS